MTDRGTARGVFTDDLVLQALSLPNLAQATAGIAKISQNLTPSAVAANTTAEQSVTVPGVLVGDHVVVVPPSLTAGVTLCNARVSAANTIQLQFGNHTAGSLTPPAGAHIIKITR